MLAININIKTERLIEADCIPDAFFEQRLVSFDGKDIIGVLFYYFRGNVLLAAHCINGHDTPFNIQQGKQLWDGRNLVALFLRCCLPQTKPVLGGESRDHVYGRIGLVVRIADAFAVDGNHFLVMLNPQAIGLLRKIVRKLNRVNGRKYPVDSVVRGKTITKRTVLAQPMLLFKTKIRNLIPLVHPAQNGRHHQQENVVKLMTEITLVFSTWLAYLTENLMEK